MSFIITFINLFYDSLCMRLFHNIVVSVFIKPEEDYDQIKEKFLSLFPFDLKKNKVPVDEKNASTFYDRTIKILEVKLEKERVIKEFMNSVLAKLSKSDKEMLIRQINTRLDDDLNFYFRLSKKQVINDGVFGVVDHGNCYHFRCHVATYPKSKNKAKQLIVEFLQNR